MVSGVVRWSSGGVVCYVVRERESIRRESRRYLTLQL